MFILSIPASKIRYVLITTLWLLLLTGFTAAQVVKTTAGSTASGFAPGSPDGSYALSGFDNINLYNGNLNFRLPLLQVGGRGATGYTAMLASSTKGWAVRQTYDRIYEQQRYSPTGGPGFTLALTPGSL